MIYFQDRTLTGNRFYYAFLLHNLKKNIKTKRSGKLQKHVYAQPVHTATITKIVIRD